MSTAEVPALPAALPQVRLKIARRSSHPWIFQKMVEKPATRLPPGSVVDIIDRDGQWVGRGFYNGHSRITLRVLTTDAAEAIDDAFFARRIGRAVELRRNWLGLDAVTDAYRLVHSEGDGLSGLVVDRFGPIARAGVFLRRHVPLPQRHPGGAGEPLPRRPILLVRRGARPETGVVRLPAPEPPPPEVITEHGVRFRVAPGSKHKTGFFLDQRDNRRALAASAPAGACSTSAATPAASPSTPRRWAAPRRWSASISTSRRSPWPGRTPG